MSDDDSPPGDREWDTAANRSTTGHPYRVRGAISGAGATGVLGENPAGDDAVGVRGRAGSDGTSGRVYGVEGITPTDADDSRDLFPAGVHGRATGGGAGPWGVFGEATEYSGTGVVGEATSDSYSYTSYPFPVGIVGVTDRSPVSPSGQVGGAVGVVGRSSYTGFATIDGPLGVVGVVGSCESTDGYGVVSDGKLYAEESVDGTPAATNHVAYFRNRDSGDGHLLALEADGGTSPGSGTNFVTFKATDTSTSTTANLGAIEGNGGGVNYNSGSADVAEYFPKADPARSFEPGDVVGLADGELVGAPLDADAALVVSGDPMVTGNVPDDERAYERVALLGQVDVTASGPVESGSVLVADEGGTAVARANSDRRDPPVVGIALGSLAGDDGRVRTLVTPTPLRSVAADRPGANGRGSDPAAEFPERVAALESENERLRAENERLRDRLERLEARVSALESPDVSVADDD